MLTQALVTLHENIQRVIRGIVDTQSMTSADGVGQYEYLKARLGECSSLVHMIVIKHDEIHVQ